MTLIKICGLSRAEDIIAANRARPDFIGFVFAPSRRQISERQAARLAEVLDPKIKAVGVFVNERSERIVRLFEQGIIQMAQLHGNEDVPMLAELKAICPDLGLIKAYRPLPGADYLLLDNAKPGSGISLANNGAAYAHLKQQIDTSPLPVFLAGGINRENIDKALTLDPYCIDISSGAESEGIKDPQKMAQLVNACRRPRQKNGKEG
ncbi:MAG: phosphoribosylanthranilate isomerase [Coriobacteriaceae bacterium]|jgi:phosphoribosylanthranilate isomerase|nr:phosphoribosylanthranilate isomerase [Coriobacteriaceae bacterium]